MVSALQRRKLNMFQWREGMLSPRALVRGNPARAKFAAENSLLPDGTKPLLELMLTYNSCSSSKVFCGIHLRAISWVHMNFNLQCVFSDFLSEFSELIKAIFQEILWYLNKISTHPINPNAISSTGSNGKSCRKVVWKRAVRVSVTEK